MSRPSAPLPTGLSAEKPTDTPALETAPFTDWMGVKIVHAGDGHTTLHLALRPEMANRRHVAHGGVIATLLDSAMARAARTLPGITELGGTVDLHVQFMTPGLKELTVHASVQHHTRTLAFCQGRVHDASGALIATGSATLRLRRPVQAAPATTPSL